MTNTNSTTTTTAFVISTATILCNCNLNRNHLSRFKQTKCLSGRNKVFGFLVKKTFRLRSISNEASGLLIGDLQNLSDLKLVLYFQFGILYEQVPALYERQVHLRSFIHKAIVRTKNVILYSKVN